MYLSHVFDKRTCIIEYNVINEMLYNYVQLTFLIGMFGTMLIINVLNMQLIRTIRSCLWIIYNPPVTAQDNYELQYQV